MPSLRPQHRRGNGAVGVTLMRSANQFNDAKRMRLPRVGRRRMHAPHTGGQRAHLRESRRSNRSIVRVSGDSSKLHEMTKAPRRLAQSGACARRMRCAGTPLPASPLTSPATPKRNTQEWRDSRVVHDSRGLCSEKTPSWQDLRAVYSRKAICRAFRIHGARILPKSAHFGCMAAICCQEGALFPSEAPFGIHEAQNLPRIAARERTRAKYCHRQAPENAPWRHGVERRHQNEASANSTPHADTSKKP